MPKQLCRAIMLLPMLTFAAIPSNARAEGDESRCAISCAVAGIGLGLIGVQEDLIVAYVAGCIAGCDMNPT